MEKFDINLFFKILSKQDFKSLVKKIPVVDKPEFLFRFALAKGYGINDENFINDLQEVDDTEPYPLKEKIKQIDKRLSYKPIFQIEDGDDKHIHCVDLGLLGSKNEENVFLIYNYFTTAEYNYPQVVKIYKKNKIPNILGIKKDASKIIKEFPYPTPFIKKKLNQKNLWKK